MSEHPFDEVTIAIPRDRWQRPLVTPIGGGKPIAYTRCTTFVGVLEDTFNLSQWQQRMVILGLAERPDLMLSAAAHRGDNKVLNQIAKDAQEAAKAHAAATTGTALHSLTERMDRGLEVGAVPGEYAADLKAYAEAVKPFRMVEIEQFGVQDDLCIGGTWDRLVEYRGRHYIADLKTGSVDYGMGKIAMQLGVYAHATPYHPASAARIPRDIDIDTTIGYVIHLPAGTGTCRVLEVDIAAGWDAVVNLAAPVREWRSRKDLSRPFIHAPLDIPALIQELSDIDALRALWAQCTTQEDRDLVAARAALVKQGAAA